MAWGVAMTGGGTRGGTLRVLHVMESTIGGTRRHIRDVARRQAERGLDVHLVVSAERQPAFREVIATA